MISSPSYYYLITHKPIYGESVSRPSFSIPAFSRRRSNKKAVFPKPLAIQTTSNELPDISHARIKDLLYGLEGPLTWPDRMRTKADPSNALFSTHPLPGGNKKASRAQFIGDRLLMEDCTGLQQLPSREGKYWQKLLPKAFRRLQEETQQHMLHGSTLLAAILNSKGKLNLGWIGDSRAYWVSVDKKKGTRAIIPLTQDHNVRLPGESDKIKRLGGVFVRPKDKAQDYLLSAPYSIRTPYFDEDLNQNMMLESQQRQSSIAITRTIGMRIFPHLIREGCFKSIDITKLLKPHEEGYLVLVTDGCPPFGKGMNAKDTRWSALFKQAVQHSQDNHAAWLVGLAQHYAPEGTDNSSAIVVPISPRTLPKNHSSLFMVADGQSVHAEKDQAPHPERAGAQTAEFVIKRLPKLLASGLKINPETNPSTLKEQVRLSQT